MTTVLRDVGGFAPAGGGAPLRVLHLTTWGERCGIADYARDFIAGMADAPVIHDVFPLNRRLTKYYPPGELRAYFDGFIRVAAEYDVVHIQHEFSFFCNDQNLPQANRNFFDTVGALRAAGRPVAVTFHTEPPPMPLGRSWRERLRDRIRKLGPPFEWVAAKHFGPTATGIRALVHAKKSRPEFARFGFAEHLLTTIPMGIGARSPALHNMSREEARARLGVPADAVLLSLFGFIAEYKGPVVAVKALRCLPERFRLAVVGGVHPEGGDQSLERMFALWRNQDPTRLHVTGYADPATIDLYHAASDICVAPYVIRELASSAAISWALNSGKPVVASSIPTFRELNEQADCMVLTTPNCPRELAWQLERVAADRPLQDRLVANAKKYVASRTWERVGREVLKVYGELTGRSLMTSERPASSILPPLKGKGKESLRFLARRAAAV